MRTANTSASPLPTLGAMIAAAVGIVLIALPAGAQQDQAEPVEPATTQPVRATGPLLFVGPTKNAPYSFLDADGYPTGYDVEVMNAIAEKLARNVEIKLMPTEEVAAAVADGQADGVIGLGLARGQGNPQETWSLCGPTVTRNYRIAVSVDTDWLDDDANHHDLKGLRVVIGQADPVVGLFEGNRNVTLEFADSPTLACQQVHARRVRAFVADQNTIQYAARKLTDEKLRMIGKPFYRVESYGPAVPKDGEPLLAESTRDAIASLQREGALANLQNKWFAYEVNPRSYTRPIVTIAAAVLGAAILVGVVFVWLRTLRKTVTQRTRKLNAELEVLRKQLSDMQRARPADGEAAEEDGPIAEAAPFGPEPTDLADLIESCVDPIRQSVGRRTELTLEVSRDLPPALVDEKRVERMMVQLCNNACDAIDKHRETHPDTPRQIWISTRIAKPAEKPADVEDVDGGFVAISVRDPGCGIRPEMVQRIFHRGYTTKPNAAGRGLTYVYETVAEHGGWIDVESAVGRGATFSIFLPVART